MSNRPEEGYDIIQKFDDMEQCIEGVNEYLDEIKKDQIKQYDNIISKIEELNKNIEMRLNEFNAFFITLNNRVGSMENQLTKIDKKINNSKINTNNKQVIITGGSTNNNNNNNIDNKNNDVKEVVKELEDSKVSQKLQSEKPIKKPRINTFFMSEYLKTDKYRQKYLLDDEEFYEKLKNDESYIGFVKRNDEHELRKFEAKKVWAKLRGNKYKKDKADIRKDLDEKYS